ncbi:hypothetical protein BDZ94DRAFT_331836 [Collybia nuda]|uniref:F-box domain-containing protein n=1 Tax=Collybia nuda TaxID=64659 RepID=A0A9P5XW74_9AGAR|nr:hypothetical protein BDZ94DRAFT_331836 [Collybia nuda]
MRESGNETPELKSNRRRSLGALFRIPLSARSPDYHSISTSKPVGSVPADIIREIVDLLSPADILSFSLTSKSLHTLLLPPLYDSVALRSSRKCESTLELLGQRPDLCALIRKLAVRPNYYLAWPKPDKPLDEEWVASKIAKIAPYLTSLNTFDWDGLEVPVDVLWSTLRTCCPDLRHVFCNVGALPLNPESQLFRFSDLKSFSLIVRYGLGGTELFPPLEDLPDEFWEMILHRCPDLEELAVCSFSSCTRIFDVLRVTEGHWPSLNSLTLGSFGYQSDFTLGPADDQALADFLEDHSTLQFIRLQWNFKRWMSPSDIPMHLPKTALPKLDTFIGIYQQLAELPNPGSIETLDLTCEPLHESRLETICPILQNLTSLTCLDIWAHVRAPNQDHNNLFYSILSSCPKLTDFHFMCTTSFTFKPLKQLLTQLHLLPDLKRFSLTKGHQYRDESMLQSALHIMTHSRGLKQINIRWAREKSPNHLKQEGTYDITHDDRGRPVALMVVERGIPLLGPPFYRRYKHKIKAHRVVSSLKPAKLIQLLS